MSVPTRLPLPSKRPVQVLVMVLLPVPVRGHRPPTSDVVGGMGAPKPILALGATLLTERRF